jgi:hypothetical protein
MSAPAQTPSRTWIRFEAKYRWHAVYVEARGGFWTFCGRFTRPEGVRDSGPQSRSHPMCLCCKSRVRLPYLVPAKLVKILQEASR